MTKLKLELYFKKKETFIQFNGVEKVTLMIKS